MTVRPESRAFLLKDPLKSEILEKKGELVLAFSRCYVDCSRAYELSGYSSIFANVKDCLIAHIFFLLYNKLY